MLVLSRKKNEVIRINRDITITVIEIRGDKVRLGIDAPEHVTVHRQEVYEAIQREQRKGKLGMSPHQEKSDDDEDQGQKQDKPAA